WVPPAVEVEHVVGGGQVEAEPAGAQGEDEDLDAVGRFLEALDHLIAPLGRRAAVEELHADPEALGYHPLQQMAHLSELRENQRRVALVEQLFEHFGQALALAAAPIDRA